MLMSIVLYSGMANGLSSFFKLTIFQCNNYVVEPTNYTVICLFVFSRVTMNELVVIISLLLYVMLL